MKITKRQLRKIIKEVITKHSSTFERLVEGEEEEINPFGTGNTPLFDPDEGLDLIGHT